MAIHEIHPVLEFPKNPEMDREEEVAEWLDAFDEVLDQDGAHRGCDLLTALMDRARESGVKVPVQLNTPYINTIPVEEEVPYPGDRHLERRIKSLIRWNAMAMVVRAEQDTMPASAATSPPTPRSPRCSKSASIISSTRSYGDQPGDFIYFQGHASPGVYARAFLEGRLSEEHLENFRHELRDASRACRPIRIPG